MRFQVLEQKERPYFICAWMTEMCAVPLPHMILPQRQGHIVCIPDADVGVPQKGECLAIVPAPHSLQVLLPLATIPADAHSSEMVERWVAIYRDMHGKDTHL